ncbi:hypothetical protein ACVDG8_007665 [Mesorhizobium sp. ORM8.1]
MAIDLSIGDEIIIDATIAKLVDGRASVAIPGYNFPHSIPAPPKAKPKTDNELTGEIRRIDEDLSLGGVITLPLDRVRAA